MEGQPKMTTNNIKELEETYESIRFWGKNDDLENQVAKLYAQIKEQEARLAELKDNLKFKISNDEGLNPKFLVKREILRFKPKVELDKLPINFLKLDETALKGVYKSALGGKKFLRKYKIEV